MRGWFDTVFPWVVCEEDFADTTVIAFVDPVIPNVGEFGEPKRNRAETLDSASDTDILIKLKEGGNVSYMDHSGQVTSRAFMTYSVGEHQEKDGWVTQL